VKEKIKCWIKIRSRGNLDLVLKSLNFWLGAFSNSKYDITIYSEDIDLPEEYRCYHILRRPDLLKDMECKKLHELIQNHSFIETRWKPAAFALSAPYFFCKEEELIYNIDGDDCHFIGPIKDYLSKIEDMFHNRRDLMTLSQDMHYSYHQGDFVKFRKHHWTFGVNISKRKEMKMLIYKAMFNDKIVRAPWGNNIDYMIDCQLETHNTPYIAFITPSLFRHCWSINDIESKTLKYDISTNKISSTLIGKKEIHDKHNRTILIQ
jgi:hypothetical protein